MKTFRTHYYLQVAENAAPEVIRGAYKGLQQKWHPDKNPNRIEAATRITSLINAAYVVLNDPQLRKEYDAELDAQRKENARRTNSAEPEPRPAAEPSKAQVKEPPIRPRSPAPSREYEQQLLDEYQRLAEQQRVSERKRRTRNWSYLIGVISGLVGIGVSWLHGGPFANVCIVGVIFAGIGWAVAHNVYNFIRVVSEEGLLKTSLTLVSLFIVVTIFYQYTSAPPTATPATLQSATVKKSP